MGTETKIVITGDYRADVAVNKGIADAKALRKAYEGLNLPLDAMANKAGLGSSIANSLREAGTAFGTIRNGALTAAAGVGELLPGLGTLAAVFSAAGMAKGINDAAAALNNLNDAATITGASVEKLSALENVARRNGASLDTVTDSIVKLNLGLKEGKDGTTADILKAIGVSAEELRKQDPADAIKTVADALAQFGDGGNKARIVQELFGKSVKEVGPYLKDLAESKSLDATATARQTAEGEKFVKNMAALENSMEQAKRSIANNFLPTLNEMIERFKVAREAGQSVGRSIARAFNINGGSGLADFSNPYASLKTINDEIEKINNGEGGKNVTFNQRRLDQLKADAKELQAVIADISRKSGENDVNQALAAAPDAGKIIDAAKARKTAADEQQRAYENLTKALREKIAVDNEAVSSSEKLTDAQKDYAKFLADVSSGALKLNQAQLREVIKLYDQWLAVSQKVKEQNQDKKARLINGAIDDLKEAFGRDNEAKRDAMTPMSDQQRALRETLRQIDEKARSVREQLRRLYNDGDGDINEEQYRQSLERLTAAVNEQKEAVRGLFEEQQRLNALWQTGAVSAIQKYQDRAANVAQQTEELFTHAFTSMEDALINFTKTGKLDFKALADSIITDIIRIQARAAISNVLGLSSGGGAGGAYGLGAIGSLFGGSQTFASLMPSVADGSSVVDLGGSIAEWFSGFHGGGIVGAEPSFTRAIPRYHTGGIAGDEVQAVLRKGEGVFTRGQMAALSPAGGTQVINNVSIVVNQDGSSAVQSDKDSGKSMGRDLESAVVQICLKHSRPGGALAKKS